MNDKEEIDSVRRLHDEYIKFLRVTNDGLSLSNDEYGTSFAMQQNQMRVQNIRFTHKITCPGCLRLVNIGTMYQCFYCNLFFCHDCAENHFKTTFKGMIKILLNKILRRNFAR